MSYRALPKRVPGDRHFSAANTFSRKYDHIKVDRPIINHSRCFSKQKIGTRRQEMEYLRKIKKKRIQNGRELKASYPRQLALRKSINHPCLNKRVKLRSGHTSVPIAFCNASYSGTMTHPIGCLQPGEFPMRIRQYGHSGQFEVLWSTPWKRSTPFWYSRIRFPSSSRLQEAAWPPLPLRYPKSSFP